jgi:hypothetical protein
MFGGAVHGVDVVVAVVEEVAHLFPGRGRRRAVLAPQRLVQRGQALMRLPVGAVQARKARASPGAFEAASRRSASGGPGGGKHRVGQRLAQVDTMRSLSPVPSSVTSVPNSRASASTTAVETGRLLFSIWFR